MEWKTIQLTSRDVIGLTAGMSRLTNALLELFADSVDILIEMDAPRARSAADEWVIENYETVAGALYLLSTSAEIISRIAIDSDGELFNQPGGAGRIPERVDEKSLYENVLRRCKERGISIAKLEKETGLGNATVRGWGTAMPSIRTLSSVARYFGCTMDELLSDTKSINK